MGLVDWLRRRPQMDYELFDEWGRFPPTPPGATQLEESRYLERCSFAGLKIHAGNRLTVQLLDAENQLWTFSFPNAGLSIQPWPDGVPPFPGDLSTSNWGPQSGINYLDTKISRERGGVSTYSYELETTVMSMDIYSDPVQVTPPTRESA